MFGLMLKTAGGAMVVLAAFLVSAEKCRRLKGRVRLLDGLISGFVSLEENICGRLIPAAEALLIASEDAGDAKSIFLSAANAGGSIRERFSAALKETDVTDPEAALRYVQGICSSDEAERRTAFSLIRARLSEQRKIASEDAARLCRLYTAAGIMGGVLVVILLI